MKKLISIITQTLSGKLIYLLTQSIVFLNQLIQVLNARRQDKKDAELNEKNKKFNNLVDDISDSGSINELLDINRKEMK